MTNNGHATTTILFAFLAGATAGAIVALLTAPKSGRETRADLKQLGFTAARTALQVPIAMRAAYESASSAAIDAFSETLHEGANGPTRS